MMKSLVVNMDTLVGDRQKSQVPLIELYVGTVQSAVDLYAGYAVLNFADAITPGGGYLLGLADQEESLCLASNLHEYLIEVKDFYGTMSHPFYGNKCIYSIGVKFHSGTITDILSCAAPDLSSVELSREVKLHYCEIMRQRIKKVLDVFSVAGKDNLILGAWGCGAFGNPPQVVAELFMEELYGFNHVVFAIPDSSSVNYKTFEYSITRERG